VTSDHLDRCSTARSVNTTTKHAAAVCARDTLHINELAALLLLLLIAGRQLALLASASDCCSCTDVGSAAAEARLLAVACWQQLLPHQ